MYDSGTTTGQIDDLNMNSDTDAHRVSARYVAGKRAFDVALCLMLLPILGVVAAFLIILNPLANPGSIMFVQRRMGRHCKPFTAFKFRTMSPPTQQRRANDPLEEDRITKLGRFLRQSRIDELPQILNVLRGEMSLIGPRPDCLEHALSYISDIPGYTERHAVLPGISGLAQIELGYAEGIAATARKVEVDLHYIANRCLKSEARIFWRTILTVLGGAGR